MSYKTVILHRNEYNIQINNDNYLFDLYKFSKIHKYHKETYLVDYYGHQKKYIKIYNGKYTDWSGMVTLCCRARCHGVKESFEILQDVIKNKNIDITYSDEEKYVKLIKEYFGSRYEYVEQFPNKKSDIIKTKLLKKFRIDLVIIRDNKLLVCIEIDEDHHKYQKEEDIIREEEILATYNCNLVRIKLYEDSFNFQDYLNEIDRLLNI